MADVFRDTPLYALVPYGIRVGSVLDPLVDWRFFPASLSRDDPKLMAMAYRRTMKVFFVTEYGEDLWQVADRLTPKAAFGLASRFPMFREHVRHRVTRSVEAFKWAAEWPEDRHLMRHLVVDSERAYFWAYAWPGERHLVKHLVTDPYWVGNWNEEFPEDRIPDGEVDIGGTDPYSG